VPRHPQIKQAEHVVSETKLRTNPMHVPSVSAPGKHAEVTVISDDECWEALTDSDLNSATPGNEAITIIADDEIGEDIQALQPPSMSQSSTEVSDEALARKLAKEWAEQDEQELQKTRRPHCKYGTKCFRQKNVRHTGEYAHPSDLDWGVITDHKQHKQHKQHKHHKQTTLERVAVALVVMREHQVPSTTQQCAWI
jgi:hypothetical protein